MLGAWPRFAHSRCRLGMISHRIGRDEDKCKEKYGPMWTEYVKTVPYRFIPGVW